jgi:ABC-2 type transport system ATP-binding protein
MDEADVLSDRIAIIDHGKIVALDTSAELKKKVSGSNNVILELELSNLTPKLFTEVQSLSCVSQVLATNPTEMKIHAKGDEAIDIIIGTVRSSGGKIASIKKLEPTLEDVFIQLTGRKTEYKETREGENERRGRSRRHRHWRRRR